MSAFFTTARRISLMAAVDWWRVDRNPDRKKKRDQRLQRSSEDKGEESNGTARETIGKQRQSERRETAGLSVWSRRIAVPFDRRPNRRRRSIAAPFPSPSSRRLALCSIASSGFAVSWLIVAAESIWPAVCALAAGSFAALLSVAVAAIHLLVYGE